MSSLAKAATLIVVVSILLAACGIPVEVQSGARGEPLRDRCGNSAKCGTRLGSQL